MATPLRRRVVDNDTDTGRQHMTNGGLSRSSSTPYDMYKARSRKAEAAGAGGTNTNGSSSPSPFISGSRSGTPHVARQSAYNRDWGLGTPADSNSPVSRKGSAVASPALRGTAGNGPTRASVNGRSEGEKGKNVTSRQKRISRAFIRRRTIRQRIESLPTDLLDHIAGLTLTLSEHLQDAALGYPIGLSFHVLSLLSHLASPTSDLSVALLFGVDASSTQAASVFGGAGSAGGVKGKGGLKDLRKAAKAARVNAWSWVAAVLSFALVLISIYNAYILFCSRRKYRLWMRKQEDKPASENARLVPVHLDNDEGEPSMQDRLRCLVLEKLNEVPILNWVIPDPPDLHKGHNHMDAQIHELNVWEAPDVPMRIAVIYSPLHACLWHFAGSPLLPTGGFLAWLSLFFVMTLISAQSYMAITAFAGLVKDKSLLAAEVMREYDQKFVLPRAMPEVRDACVQTSQAETLSPDDWMTTSPRARTSSHLQSSQVDAASHHPSDRRLGKGGARHQSRRRLSEDRSN
ncbi:hypothetical protein BCV69DRAFT_297290 [Microstroma glucosiphilum]|uniref:Uncharacterized protein n=1 Tax=Pseudomicrostroma glucosiphilum TaxID=1684307 RepID=A0A316UDV3_9BASI|nr:hypothetical protein BCV69DRAFT_297290 [Pseudomicrostroma glucosiphilum]PWN23352.1 hypothetical protein BCV69DRAFT_297290 [Pseudomicrostroma glucosiphilum]